MMCVVTQEYNPAILDFKVEPTVHTPETGHSLFDLFRCDSVKVGKRHRSDTILYIYTYRYS